MPLRCYVSDANAVSSIITGAHCNYSCTFTSSLHGAGSQWHVDTLGVCERFFAHFQLIEERTGYALSLFPPVARSGFARQSAGKRVKNILYTTRVRFIKCKSRVRL
jgi:hypothetical protein